MTSFCILRMLITPPSVCVSAWAVMMDRRQQRLQLVLLPPALFIPAHQAEASRQESLEALGDSVHPFIIYQETSDIWINVRVLFILKPERFLLYVPFSNDAPRI